MAEKFAKPYVDALFEIAGSAAAVEALLPGLDTFTSAVKTGEDFRQLLGDPKVSRNAKNAILTELGRRAGLPDIGCRLLVVLHANKRILSIGAVVDAIRERLDTDRNIIKARVESAVPLSDAVRQKLTAILSKKTGADVRLEATVKPEVLGGLVVKIGSEVYDTSVALRLEKVRQSLLSVS